MLLPRNTITYISILTLALALINKANAGLYGFDNINPYTQSEGILSMDYLPDSIPNYRAEMRNNLLMLIEYARSQNPNFQILAHEGQELLLKSRWEYDLEGYNRVRDRELGVHDPAFLFTSEIGTKAPKEGSAAYRYLKSINAIILNNIYCGDGIEENITINNNLGFISIEQCSDELALDSAITRSVLDHKVIYAFTDRKNAFKDIFSQPLINDSARNIEKANQAQNITFILDDSNYNSAEEMVAKISNSNHDIVVINPFFHNNTPFSPEDVRRMSFKKNGASRLIIATLNVSEASPSDYFWNHRWRKGNPSWLVRNSFVTDNALITRYWSEEWKQILSQYMKDIIASGYSGILFTGIENHNYFEHLTPLE